jgi:hypothetical protein
VLPRTDEAEQDPWERGFDEVGADAADEEPDDASDELEDTAEGAPAVAVDGEESSRRRFRRR